MELRPMRETDRALVINSWVRSYSERSPEARDYTGAAMGLFGRDYTRVVVGLLERSRVIVASLADNPDSAIAWMCWEGETLHYVLVKRRWRKLGVARWMLADFGEMPVAYTHRTREALRCPVPKGWAYRRWLIWPAGKEAA
jgi:hypothetical protein